MPMHKSTRFSALPVMVLLAVFATATSPATARAGTWLDEARTCCRPGTIDVPRAHAEPRAPIESGRAIFDSTGYALNHGFDVTEIQHHAFPELQKGGIFDETRDISIYVPPSYSAFDGARGLIPQGVRLRPNTALYGSPHSGSSLSGPLGPSTPIFSGVSPRVLDFERRGH